MSGVTPDDITDAMVDELATKYSVDEHYSHRRVKGIIAASVNAYLAANPACAAGEELLATLQDTTGLLEAIHGGCHIPEAESLIPPCVERGKSLIAKAKGGEA